MVNWPEQHHKNGVSKNKETATRFKSIVRVLKALSNEMTEQGVRPGDMPGFFTECLVYNIPNDHFGSYSYAADVKGALGFLYEKTNTEEACAK